MGGARRRKGKIPNTSQTPLSAVHEVSSNGSKDDGPRGSLKALNDQRDAATTTSSLQQVFFRHPLFWALVVLGIPYGLHVGRRYVLLQKSHWIPSSIGGSTLILPSASLRPPVAMTDPRQMLIIGVIASGTSQVSHEISTTLQLEIGHEDSDTLWQFVRDGTVSWFHGIRFMNPQDKEVAVPALCKVAFSFYKSGKSKNYGFGPTLFGTPNYSRSFLHPKFHEDWMEECHRMVSNEYGCAVAQRDRDGGHESMGNSSSCTTPFSRTLVQYRHPRKIVNSLVNKYCNDNGVLIAAPDSLLRFLFTLFAASKEDEVVNIFSKTLRAPENCAWQMIHYVIWWYRDILLPRVADGTIDAKFPVEMSGVCSVAEMAGLNDKDTTIYVPNHDAYVNHCVHNATNPSVHFGRTKNVQKENRSKLPLAFPNQTEDQIFDIESQLEDLARAMGYQ